MAILNKMWITIELPRRDGGKDATIQGGFTPGDVVLVWCGQILLEVKHYIHIVALSPLSMSCNINT